MQAHQVRHQKAEFELKISTHFALKGSGGEGDLTSSPTNTTEGVGELVQLPALGMEHIEVEVGLNPQLTFCCQNLNKWRSKEKCARILSLHKIVLKWW